MSDHDIEKLLGSLPAGKDIVISCIRQKQSCFDEITLPCVGIVSKQLLAAFVLRGCKSITFQMSGCSECCNEDVSKTFRLMCKDLLEELDDLHPSTVILSVKREQLTHHEMGRRSYLTKLRQLVVGVSKKTFSITSDHLDSGLKKSRRIPFKTELIRKIITRLEGDAQTKIVRLFSHKVSITKECTCCPLCKGICPTGAIKIERSGTKKWFNFEMLDCSGCGLCVEFCKSNAILLTQHCVLKPDFVSKPSNNHLPRPEDVV
ncbi:MAG: 4Fe-4S binding protein [Desulfobacterales bacterium]|nr:4Fe-4S binding protein [Desulfobacterales bacterium]